MTTYKRKPCIASLHAKQRTIICYNALHKLFCHWTSKFCYITDKFRVLIMYIHNDFRISISIKFAKSNIFIDIKSTIIMMMINIKLNQKNYQINYFVIPVQVL